MQDTLPYSNYKVIPLIDRNTNPPSSVVSFLSLIFTGMQTCEQSSPDVHPFVPDGPACSSGWIGYERKCYFFSVEERNWTSCHSFCISNNSSLAVIKNKPEKVKLICEKLSVCVRIGS